MNRIFFCIIVSFCIFSCKPKELKEPKEEIKKIGNIDKPLNLSLLFRDAGGVGVSYDTIDGNEIRTVHSDHRHMGRWSLVKL